jgi:anaerobic magnesium-protoporphyrin IX monomethyl ester cyclase
MDYYLGDIGRWTGSAVYSVLTTRGCPYRCTYCVNNAMVDLYPDWCKLRRRSAVRVRLPSIGALIIRDDVFLANPESYIAEFCQLYKEVGLPFQAYTTAQTADWTKLQLIVDAGLRLPIMGIQSGSARIQKLYQRHTSNEQMLRAARLIHSFRDRVSRPMYDLITDNPYETDEDRFETLQFIHSLPPPYKLSLYSLTFYPGTEIYRRAKADGFIRHYRK